MSRRLEERLVAFMQEEAYRPLDAEELAERLQLRGKELPLLWEALAALEQQAMIVKTRYDRYGLPARMNLVVGRLALTNKGFGFVIPEVRQQPEESDVFVAPDDMGTAMHNDRVVVRVHSRQPAQGRSREGEIIRIVDRANLQVVGLFEAGRNYGFVRPDDVRLGQDIFVPKEAFGGAASGSKVVVEITHWPERKRSAEGRIVEVLGRPGDAGLEVLSILRRHQLPAEFEAPVLAEADAVAAAVLPAELEGRRDLRHLPIVTIDGEDAKDLDDAVHVEALGEGGYRLGVYIADVSHYVREGSRLDAEARQRGTSVYLVDRVLPMLPQRLSNGICSLNAQVDRLAMACEMEIDGQGRVRNYEIFPAVIRVAQRFTYTVVRQLLLEGPEAVDAVYRPHLPHIRRMEQLCRVLRERRMRRGAVDFDFPELKVKLDEQGVPLEIVKRVRTIAESVIEEFMLVANETVAEHMYRLQLPFLFRVHEDPEPEKLVKLDSLLHNFGQQLRRTQGEVRPASMQQVLTRIAGRPEERIISTVMLRSLKQARYEAANLGHFGLAAQYYTHFTSPIRRYPDLIVHRMLREWLQKGFKGKRREKLDKVLPEIALHSSLRERAAAEAERETVQLKLVEYMERFVGEDFDGVISSVTAFGFFVELDNGVEGLVHVSTLDDDYYQFVEERYCLLGERTRTVFQLGQAVRVRLVRVNTLERNIDFQLVSGGVRATGEQGGVPGNRRKPGKPKEPRAAQGAKAAAGGKQAGPAAAKKKKAKSQSAAGAGQGKKQGASGRERPPGGGRRRNKS